MIELTQEERQKLKARQDFRYYGRKIFLAPNNRYYHEQRINAALLLNEKEPLQGALADFFYACWYDIPYDVESIFAQVQHRLSEPVREKFSDCIYKLDYIQHSSIFATRWSVLVAPSLNEDSQRLLISSDDAGAVAQDITNSLIDARENQDWQTIEYIENDFFSHCVARSDRLSFSLVWFRLGKNGWDFDERWNQCQQSLSQTDSSTIA